MRVPSRFSKQGLAACMGVIQVLVRPAGSIFETKKRWAITALLYSRFTLLTAEVGILSARLRPAV